MDIKVQRDLEKAKEHFFALRLLDAYTIFRRYFDRIPFQIESGHAEYIGLFVRTLYELGKKNELKFYMAEIEKWHRKEPRPEITYQLAVVYSDADGPHLKLAVDLLLEITSNPEMVSYHAKAKLYLAYCYDVLYNDVELCKKVINSIHEPCDAYTAEILETWKAKVLRDSGKLSEAETALKEFLGRVTHTVNWYSFGVANVLLAGVYLRKGNPEKARAVLTSLRTLYEGKPMKSLRQHMAVIERELERSNVPSFIDFAEGGTVTHVTYQDQTYDLEMTSPVGRLLNTLLKEKFIDKRMIVNALYQREYRKGQDDSLIYYHVHALRKQLQKMGVNPEVLLSEAGGYRLTAEVRNERLQ